MQRHALLYRNQQAWFSRQPLIARMKRQQRLARLLLPASRTSRDRVAAVHTFLPPYNWQPPGRQRVLELPVDELAAYTSVDGMTDEGPPMSVESLSQAPSLERPAEAHEGSIHLIEPREDVGKMLPSLPEEDEVIPAAQIEEPLSAPPVTVNVPTEAVSTTATSELPDSQTGSSTPIEIVGKKRTRPAQPVAHQMPPANREDVPPATTSIPPRDTEEELFKPQQQVDRSPQAWAARLKRAAQSVEQSVAHQMTTIPQQLQRQVHGEEQGKAFPPTQFSAQVLATTASNVLNEAVPLPTVLAQQSRRFLQPIVGSNPTSANIFRDERQGIAASPTNAIVSGEELVAREGLLVNNAAEQLRPLASEFLQERKSVSRFIPPVLSSSSEMSYLQAIAREKVENAIVSPLSSGLQQENGEELTTFVEGRVRQAAQAQPDALLEAGAQATAVSPGNQAQKFSRTANGLWGNLPAPWEPLPDWLAPASQESAIQQGTPSTLMGSIPAVQANSALLNDAYEQTAEPEHFIDEELPLEREHVGSKAPEVDLDQLARQVYARIKRRLAVESRRES